MITGSHVHNGFPRHIVRHFFNTHRVISEVFRTSADGEDIIEGIPNAAYGVIDRADER